MIPHHLFINFEPPRPPNTTLPKSLTIHRNWLNQGLFPQISILHTVHTGSKCIWLFYNNHSKWFAPPSSRCLCALLQQWLHWSAPGENMLHNLNTSWYIYCLLWYNDIRVLTTHEHIYLCWVPFFPSCLIFFSKSMPHIYCTWSTLVSFTCAFAHELSPREVNVI